MTRAKADRRLGGRLQPFFDRLEARLALSGSGLGAGIANNMPTQLGVAANNPSLSIVSTTPATSSTLSASPTTILVTFDRPLDAFSLNNRDFVLVHVASDGSTTPLNPGEALLSENLDPSDPTGSRIALALNKPLVNGNYELLLEPTSQFQGTDGTSLSTNGSIRVLSDFTISAANTGLAGAVDLKTIGSTELVRTDVLHLGTNPAAVKYYKLTLAPGHFWRLGLEVTSIGNGGNLTSTLSLFDSTGRLISTNSIGLPDDPGDPYLFQGLGPGTYYVGVSARGNIPDSSGNYNPGQAILASTSSAAGGPFRLQVVADPADQPTQVLGLRLDHADPLSTAPTGLTIQFSDSIQLASLVNLSIPAVTLVDQNGESWSLTPSHYDGTQGQLSFVFDQSLPAGTYTLNLFGQKELIDLDGQAPVALGQAPGVLGSFTVLPSIKTPGDLGPLLPTIAQKGLTSTFSIDPNSSTSSQFTVLGGGVYAISGVNSTSGVALTLTDASGNAINADPTTSSNGQAFVDLKPGLYTLTLTNSGSTAIQVPVTLREIQIVFSQLLQSGIAQGDPFSLRFVTPQADFGAATQSTPTSVAPTPTGNNSTPPSGSSTASGSGAQGVTPAIGQNTPSSPSVAGILYGLAPVGRPSSLSNQISVVGPSASSGSVALATNSPGLPLGLVAIPVSITPGGRSSLEVIPVAPDIETGDIAALRPGSDLDSGVLARSPGSLKADDRALDEADWIGRVVSDAFGWMGRSSATRAETPSDAQVPTVNASVDELASGIEHPQVQTANFSSPIVVVAFMSSVAYRYRQHLLNLLRKAFKLGSKQVATNRPSLSGPHHRHRMRIRTKIH